MSNADITQLLQAIDQGDGRADELLGLVYDELHQLASGQMRRERPNHTLQATALVHEAFLRMTSGRECTWENRRHFFGAAAEAMRRILVEQARHKARLKRGGDMQRVNLPVIELAEKSKRSDILALDEALVAFETHAADKAELVKMRYFAGLDESEAAQALGISRATAARWWAYSKAWLFERIQKDG